MQTLVFASFYRVKTKKNVKKIQKKGTWILKKERVFLYKKMGCTIFKNSTPLYLYSLVKLKNLHFLIDDYF